MGEEGGGTCRYPEGVVPVGRSRHLGPGGKEDVVTLEVARVEVVRVEIGRLGLVRVGGGCHFWSVCVCIRKRNKYLNNSLHRLCHTELNQGFIQHFTFGGESSDLCFFEVQIDRGGLGTCPPTPPPPQKISIP